MSALTGGVFRTLRPIDFASGSVSVGDIDTIASGYISTAVGAGAQALQYQALAVGNLAVANSYQSIAIGPGAQSLQDHGTAIGQGAVVEAGANASLAVGYNAHAFAGASTSVALGYNAAVHAAQSVSILANITTNGTQQVIVGDSSDSAGTSLNVLVGANSHVTNGGRNIVIGSGSQTDSDDAVVIGTSSQVSSATSTAIGPNVRVDAGSVSTVAIGESVHVTASSGGSVAIGTDAFVDGSGGNSGGESICIGSRSQTKGLQAIRIGVGGDQAPDWSIWLGDNILHTVNAAESVCIGHQSSVIDKGVTVGSQAQGSSDSVTLGLLSLTQSVRSIAVGSTAQVFLGSSATESIAIGYLSAINDGINITTSNQSIAIGTAATVIGSDSVSLGHSAVVGEPTLESDDCLAFGHQAFIHGHTHDAIAIGHSTVVGTGSDYGIVVGNNAQISDGCTNGIAIGQGATLPVGANYSQAYGYGATPSGPNEVVFGSLSGTGSIDTFGALSTLFPTANTLFSFSAGKISGIHDTAFTLMFMNALGNVVAQQVKIDGVTGFLHVNP